VCVCMYVNVCFFFAGSSKMKSGCSTISFLLNSKLIVTNGWNFLSVQSRLSSELPSLHVSTVQHRPIYTVLVSTMGPCMYVCVCFASYISHAVRCALLVTSVYLVGCSAVYL
jgi:hypothetical protein